MPECDIEQETWAKDLVRELRRPVRLRLDFDRQVMAQVRRGPQPRRRMWSRRFSVTVTPVRALALAASMAALAVGSGWFFSRQLQSEMRQERPAAVAANRAAPWSRPVQFVVVAPEAAEVTLVGDFNGWDSMATPMRMESPGGVWSVTVPLPAGRYQYAFVINGREWRADPAAPTTPVDDFGSQNSIIAVTEQVS